MLPPRDALIGVNRRCGQGPNAGALDRVAVWPYLRGDRGG